ncbi:putative beta-galactosidase A [Cladophialophora carrionii]|uniref:Beta-galactosidase n=1 Tax=Cladophialophora carrionii TaxID=86049 RepID=A0A1C1CGG2_9EURO|nr:putative beta-galactosidase A [Cladophialophora carrionii]
MRVSTLWTLILWAAQAAALAVPIQDVGRLRIIEHPNPEKRQLLQDIVTWDDTSLFIRGERVMIFSGEFHPFRLPVPALWVDIFQKVKALGFNCVSYYLDWALLEGKPGNFSAEGVLALEPFYDAATAAGVYLIARPGPYINAEASGGGFPGWLARLRGRLRTTDPDYIAATQNYIRNVASSIATAQITNGGPVILYQPENEYTGACCGVEFPNGQYMQDVIDQAHSAGVVVPMISNDASASGHNAPGTGVGQVDIYGHDNYPLGFDCSHPTVWPDAALPTTYWQTHLNNSPSTPYSINEFQGGSFDPWGGPGFAKCEILVNYEFVRVFYKNVLASAVKIFNLYMIFGGTNWGGLGHPGGYTSYDYAAAISENRQVDRQKYSEIKLLANFVKASPAYLTATPQELNTTSVFTDTSDLKVTSLTSDGSATTFYIVRHYNCSSLSSTSYRLLLPTSIGNLTIPQLGGSLTLGGRDSKVHAADYDLGGTNLLYSTAEIFTWKIFGDRTVLIVYGDEGEHHELAVTTLSAPSVIEGEPSTITTNQTGSTAIIAWDTSPIRRVVQVGQCEIYLLDKSSAYDYWVPEVSGSGASSPFTTTESINASIIVKAGYLVRQVYLQSSELHLTVDVNDTTVIEVIGVPESSKALYINGEPVQYHMNARGDWSTCITYQEPTITIPALESLEWKFADSLPEIQASYDDSSWTAANLAYSNNTVRNLTTPTSLYASDYGYHSGSLIYRGHFTAKDTTANLSINTQGGWAFGHSIWLDQSFVGSYAGVSTQNNTNATYTLSGLRLGANHNITVLIDHMGMEESGVVGTDKMKTPRGILDYALAGYDKSAVTWRLTGNLGGEDYLDRRRGPLNEGAMYAERQGWHLPSPPSQSWENRSPMDGIPEPGVGFFSTSFDLNIPTGWDFPMSFVFGNDTKPPVPYRAQLFVNGFQFGKYVNHIGPQTRYPVPQGILNYNGTNWLALTLWAHESGGAGLGDFELVYDRPIATALKNIAFVGSMAYAPRPEAY